jgi:hypothetical protein
VRHSGFEVQIAPRVRQAKPSDAVPDCAYPGEAVTVRGESGMFFLMWALVLVHFRSRSRLRRSGVGLPIRFPIGSPLFGGQR